MTSTGNPTALFDKSIDTGNGLIYRELVKQHTHTVNQLGSWLLYSMGDDGKMKQCSHRSYLITCLAEMLSQAAAKCSRQFTSCIQVQTHSRAVMHSQSLCVNWGRNNKLTIDTSYKLISFISHCVLLSPAQGWKAKLPLYSTFMYTGKVQHRKALVL